MPEGSPEPVPIRLPASGEELRGTLSKLGKPDWKGVMAAILDCPIPAMNKRLFLEEDIPQVIEWAEAYLAKNITGDFLERVLPYVFLQKLDAGCASDGETTLAKDALRVQSLDECTLLETRCVLPEAGDIAEQYDCIEDLVLDGNNLGVVLDECGQGAEDWIERFAAALEYESCHSLRFALDIFQNLNCYEWVSCDKLEEFASDYLRSCGVSEDLIQSGSINLTSYVEDLLENSGYMLIAGESAYVTRNAQTFSYNYSTDREAAALSNQLPKWQEQPSGPSM